MGDARSLKFSPLPGTSANTDVFSLASQLARLVLVIQPNTYTGTLYVSATVAALWFRTQGFCLVCFAAVAAFHALDALGCGRVAMLDFDVHHGNGVAALVKGDARVCVHRQPLAMQG